jgi:hypothetical protein
MKNTGFLKTNLPNHSNTARLDAIKEQLVLIPEFQGLLPMYERLKSLA